MHMSELRGMKSATREDEELLRQHEEEMWGGDARDNEENLLDRSREDEDEYVPQGISAEEISEDQRNRMQEKKKEALRKAAERKAQRAQQAAEDEEAAMVAAAMEAEAQQQQQMEMELEDEEAIADEIMMSQAAPSQAKQPKQVVSPPRSRPQRPSSPVELALSQDSGAQMGEMEGTGTVVEAPTQTQDSGAAMLEMEGVSEDEDEEEQQPAEELGSQRSRRANAGRKGRVTKGAKNALEKLAAQKDALARLVAARKKK